MNRRLLIALLALAPAVASAQPGNRPVRSPEVDDQGRVTFRLRAPNAQSVQVARDGVAPADMKKDDQGVWSLTTDALEPDIYPYTFTVDGNSLPDPANTRLKPSVLGLGQSLVHVPGPADLTWEESNIPRGTLHHHYYHSAIAAEARDFIVYTPPGYDPAADQKYPVLYLLHGITDDARAWTAAGRAHVILDNLIARGQARPMIVVMPLGYAFPNVSADLFRLFGDRAMQRKSMDGFSATVLDELIPQVEKQYRAATDRDSRAIAGLSMGGAQSVFIGLNHPDRFGWVASFSGGFIMYGDDSPGHFPHLDELKANPPRLVWVACGTDDFLIESHRQFEQWLKSQGVTFSSKETDGAHTWMVWRRYLTDLAPLLFQPAKP